MSNPPLWLPFFVLLLLVASWWSRTLIGLIAGLVLIGVGGATALWGLPHLRDPLVLRRLKSSEYEQPQQPGVYAIALGGILVVVGGVAVRGWMRRQDQ